MRRLILSLAALFAFLPALARAQDAIKDVIARQLDAFNARDVTTAWSFASPMIQGQFGSAQNFGRMVEQGYPMVWTNADPRSLDRETRGARQVQRVMLRDSDGALHMLDYYMIETEDGWEIDGVSLLQAPELGV